MTNISTKLPACTKKRKHQINVVLRVRPLQNNISSSAIQVDPSTGVLQIHDTSYQFADHVVCGSDQDICFDATSSRLMSQIQQGISCCLLAYGQTGSGKTYTMFGPAGELTETALNEAQRKGCEIPSLWGLFPRVALQLLQIETLCSIQVSVVEVYQDSAFDLLDRRKVLPIGRTRARGIDLGNGQLHPSGCYCKHCFNSKSNPSESGTVCATRQTLNNPVQVAQLARTIELIRVAKGHLLNTRSSRSHCLVSLYVTLESGNKRITPTFLFVDLAGSERIKKSGVEGVASKEAMRINSSLTILGRVTKALADKSNFVPYRDCTLTRLLQPIFTGQACASFIVNIASESEHCEESKMSLQFARRLKGMHVRAAVTVEGWKVDEQQQQLKAQVKQLRKDIEAMKQKGMHGHFGPDAIPSEKITLKQNMKKLAQLETNVNSIRVQMKEAKDATTNESRRRQLLFQSEQASFENLQAVVEREKTIKKLWTPPRPLYTQKYNELQQVEAILQQILRSK